MTKTDRMLIVALLRMAADEYSNHGCNDFNLRGAGLSPREIDKLRADMAKWSGDPDEALEDGPYGEDYRLMEYLADKLSR